MERSGMGSVEIVREGCKVIRGSDDNMEYSVGGIECRDMKKV
jgi:hypothetical protein